MILFDFLGAAAPIPRALLLTGGAIAWTLLLARLVGPQAFSKATVFGFAATIATGSLIAQAGTRSDWSQYAQAMAAIGALFLIRYLLAHARLAWPALARVIDNTPVLLVRDGEVLKQAMRQAGVTEATLMEKVRASGASRLSEVRAMVLETTGDFTVMTADSFDERLLDGVRRVGAGPGTMKPSGE